MGTVGRKVAEGVLAKGAKAKEWWDGCGGCQWGNG